MIKVGITGGIGSGKSTICNFFELLNIPIYYADFASKYLLNNNLSLKKKLIDAFGTEIYFENGMINKSIFSKIIFSDKNLLEKANSIIHPAVADDYKKWSQKHESFNYTLKEAAILFETGLNKEMDFVITVYTPIDERIERIKKRDNFTDQQIMERINNQMSDEIKIKNSDFVIYNSFDKFVIPQILEIHQKLTKKYDRNK